MKTTTNILFLALLVHTIAFPGRIFAQTEVESGTHLNIGEDCYLINDNDLTINSGGEVHVEGYLTVSGTATNHAGNAGFIIESDANSTGSLIEYSSIDAVVERFITQDIYHYLSAPVSGQSISLLQVGTPHTDYDLFWYDENEGSGTGPLWIDASAQTGNLETGLGYAYTYNPSDITLEFTGTTNQGTITEPVTYTYDVLVSANESYFGWNLVGNPYPSRISATAFIDDPDNADIYGTLYFWDEAAGYANGRNDYGAWNKTGAISGGGGKTPNGYIEVCQSFMVHYGSGTSPISGSISFRNAMRVHEEAVFFKSEPARVKISLENQENYNETLIGFLNTATNGFDNKYDGMKLKGNSDLSLYSKLVDDDGYDYAIQALTYPEVNKEIIVRLGFNTENEGIHKIKMLSLENLDNSTSILLEDTYENKFTDLRLSPEYDFFAGQTGTYDDRFKLHFNRQNQGLDEEEDFANDFIVYNQHGNIIIDNQHHQDVTVDVFNTIGKLIVRDCASSHQKMMINLQESSGLYIVRITSEGNMFSKKVFIK